MLDWQQGLKFKLQPEMYAVEGCKADGTDSWRATEKPEMYAVESCKADGTDSWRATEKPVIEGESSIATAVQVPPLSI